MSGKRTKATRKKWTAGFSFFPNSWKKLSTQDKNKITKKLETAAKKPTNRGWEGPGKGYATYVQAPEEWRATTRQLCGLWPFSIGAGAPLDGVPIGRHLKTHATVCCDPISWFEYAKLISNPSMFVLGMPGLGKSTVIRRMCIGLEGMGVMPLIFGDMKPDYVAMVKALGGQVISLGNDRGYLNVLDPGEATQVAKRLYSEAEQAFEAADNLAAKGLELESEAAVVRGNEFKKYAGEVTVDSKNRRHAILLSLISIVRSSAPTDREEYIIERALDWLDDNFEGVPVLADLLQVVKDAPNEVREAALDRGDLNRYKEITEGLESTLNTLAHSKKWRMFARQTSVPMRRDSAVVYDISSISEADYRGRGAALLACWSAGFGSVNAAHALADAGLERERNYFIVLDEVWAALRTGPGLVEQIDALTRLNRTKGVGQAMATHTMSDFETLSREEDRKKVRGLVERAGLVIYGGLPENEMPLINPISRLSSAEQNLITGWSAPESWNSNDRDVDAPPPGQGKFLIKVGKRAGIPISLELTEQELQINDTNQRWGHGTRVKETV